MIAVVAPKGFICATLVRGASNVDVARPLLGGIRLMTFGPNPPDDALDLSTATPFMSDCAAYYTNAELPARARYIPPVLAADRLATDERITREELDAAALASQQKAAAAENDTRLQKSRISAGRLAAEECIRPQTSAESLAAMPPAFGDLQKDYAATLADDAVVPLHTLAHAPPICDGAGLALVGGAGMSCRPRARIVAYAECGGDPHASLTAGFLAMEKVLDRSGLRLADMDRIEFMEAFAVTIAKFMRNAGSLSSRVNVAGGHLAKGHPMGASGAILASTLLDAVEACDGQFGILIATGATGVGAAMIVERLGG